ncbi:SUMF1/EgtB/PvdO family nonheme iron enzyme [Bacteroides sp. GD17]|jgi:sulfatase modifying factor 1|uniref:SUMF1/EgtB/PvdO family nonheme iron enzyme n=1 Tax=Bacteroides sp. GD17 TaxID=3139826 RepID=UPI0025FC1391|nr:SUMF1/EgtB/PvdO family nonheme iron enzyme [uncultured Bacteroides sp.]
MMNSNSLHNMARKYHRRLMLFGGLVTAILVTACLLMLLVLGACTNEALVSDAGTEIGTDTNALRFDISIAPAEELENTAEEPGTTRSRTCVTRAVTDAAFRTTFEDGDAIGIFAINATDPTTVLTASGNPIHNARLTYDAATGTWQGNIYWPAGFTGSLQFFAYYPYDDCGGHPERMNPTAYVFRAATDQNATATVATAGRDPYSLSDLMGAYNNHSYSKAAITGGSVSLLFHHLMAMIQVSVPAGPKGSGPDETLAVRLNGVQTEADMDLSDLANPRSLPIMASANEQADPVTLIMRRVEQPADADYATTYTYRALLPGQSVLSPTGLIRLDYGPWVFQDAPLADNLVLYGGSVETFTRALPASALQTVKIGAGTFLMGSSDGSNIKDKDGSGLNTTPAETGRNNSEAQHRVTLTKGFRMSRYTVTNAQYAAFLNDIKCGKDGKANVTGYGKQLLIEKDNVLGVQWNNDVWSPATGKADFPVVRVTWYGARAYADWAGASLPTEAQWEYACRAGSTTAYPGGDDEEHGLGDYGWYSFNSGNIAHPVGTKKPNAWGLYDMHGNVSEWCADWYDNDYGSTPGAPATDPAGPDTGSDRTVRNGSFGNTPKYCRSAYRNVIGPGSAYSDNGFRVVFNE